MGGFLRTSVWLGFAALLIGSLGYGQTAPVQAESPQTVIDVLHQLSDKADVIFAGQVLAIRHPNEGVVEVEFRVDQAIRGCAVGTPYVLREWAGLWAGGAQRYRVGQSLLMLLHAPGAAGMSSPVGGLDGAIPIRQSGSVTPMGDIAAPPQPPYVDLRWLGAKVPHAVAYGGKTKYAGTVMDASMPLLTQHVTAQMTASGSVTSAAPITPMFGSAGASDGSVPAQQASVNAVMGMLHSWQKVRHAAP
jgi:hypothetical protein